MSSEVNELRGSVRNFARKFEEKAAASNENRGSSNTQSGDGQSASAPAAMATQGRVRSRLLTYSVLQTTDASAHTDRTVVRASEAPRVSSKVGLFERKMKRAAGLFGDADRARRQTSAPPAPSSPVCVKELVRQFSSETSPTADDDDDDDDDDRTLERLQPPKPTPNRRLRRRVIA